MNYFDVVIYNIYTFKYKHHLKKCIIICYVIEIQLFNEMLFNTNFYNFDSKRKTKNVM